MKRKLHWGIAALIVILIAGGGFIYYQWSEVQQFKEQLAQDEKLLEDKNKPEVVAQTPIDFTKPPPGKTFEGGGHWHNGEWHDAPHAVDAPSPPVTDAQRAEWEKYWKEQGLDPPPDGHNYRYNADGSVAGLYKYNEPRFKVGWSEESPQQDVSKLTETEWIRYHALLHIMGGSLLYLDQPLIKRMMAGETLPKATYAPGVQELAEEWWSELAHKASGSTPYVTTSISWNREPTRVELEEIARKENELLKSMERPKRPRPEWQPFVESIVKELESEVEKRR